MELFAAPAKHAAASHRRMGSHPLSAAPDMSAETRLAELETTLAQVKLEPAENVPLAGAAVGHPPTAGAHPSLTPDELRRRQLAALMNWVMAGANPAGGAGA